MPSANKLNRNMMDVPFSDGYISLGVESIPFLADRPITILRFPHHRSNLLLTVHKSIAFVSIMKDRNVEVYIQYITVQWSIAFDCVYIMASGKIIGEILHLWHRKEQVMYSLS